MKDEKTFTLGEGERLERINRDLRLIQNLDGLVYGTDAYMLAAFIKPQSNGAACELGAGTGVISILCADADKFASIEAVEIQPYYAELTERNVSLNGLDGKITVRCADVRDLGGVMCGSFDAVFANPPYMKIGNGKANANEKKYIARHEVKGGICDFVKAASRLLKFGGRFYCVMRPDRLCDLMCYMRECKIEPKRIRTVHDNEKAEPSVCLVEGVRGGNPSLIFERPLFLHNVSDGCRTAEANSVYENLNFDNI
jgi:tRNA1(Val) A37 N6-methylase TrmN6